MTLFNEDDLMCALIDFAHPNQSPPSIFSSADKWPFNETYNLSSTAAVRPMYQIGEMDQQTRRRDANILVNQVAVGTSTITKAKSSTAFRVLAASKVES